MFVQRLEELASRDVILSMSGFDFMTAVLQGQIPSAPIAQTLGFALHSVESGSVAFRGAPDFSGANPIGTVHGGWYGTIMDSCMACSVMTTVPKGSWYNTLEFKVNITRNLPFGTAVEAKGTVSHAGRSTGVATGELRGVEDGKLYATGSTTCIILKG